MTSSAESPLRPIEWAAILVIVLVWGVNNAAAKFATEAMPPLLVAGLRFAMAAVCLAPFLRGPFPNWRVFLPVILLAGPLHFGLLYVAFSWIENLSLFGVTLQLWAPLTALFAWLILGERMPAQVLGGTALAFAGVAFMTLEPHLTNDLPAVLLGVFASALWAMATVLVRKLPGVRALKIQGFSAVLASPVLLGLSLALEPRGLEAARQASGWVWASIAFAGIGSTVGASALLFWLVQRREAGRVTGYLLATPLVTAALGVAYFGDEITWRMVTGAAVAILGVGLVAMWERRRLKTPPAPIA